MKITLFLKLSCTCKVNSSFCHVFTHKRIERPIVKQCVIKQTQPKTKQVDITLIEREEIDMKAIDNGVTNNSSGAAHFQVHDRHEHGKVVNTFLSPAVLDLTKN